MKEMEIHSEDARRPLEDEANERAKDDPEFADKLKVAKRIVERYSEALQRLANS